MTITSRRYHILLAILALLGFAFVLITTWKYGAGVSSDAVRAMSTAEGLLAGKGFVDFVGAAYVLWPPLYPLVLAALSLLSRLDVFHVAWYLNMALFPLNIWLWGRWFERIFPDRLIYALLASAAALVSSSMIRIYANVASDPLFVTFMILFLFAAAEFLQAAFTRSLWWMFVLAGLSLLQRYLGVVLLGVGTLVVLVREGSRGIRRMILPAALAALPGAAWVYLHNYLGFGTFLGTRAYGEMWPLENISLSLTKILHWFLPYAPGLKPLLLQPWTILLPVVGLVILLNLKRRDNWSAWGQAMAGPYVWPALAFSLVYYFLLAFTVNTIDHRDLTSDRYYVIIFPVVLIFLLLTWDHLVASHLGRARLIYLAVLALGAIWFVYPIYDLQDYLRLSLKNGEPSNYNIYNSSHFTEMKVVKVGRRLVQQHPEAAFYSNYVNLLWFQYKRPVHMLLPVNNDLPLEERIADLREKAPGWPGAEPGYLIWFTPNEYKYLAAPADLAAIAHLELIYKDDNGEIYRVTPRAGS